MPTIIDPTARRKKYALLKFVREWNAKHPRAQITQPAGFRPETDIIGTPAREFLKNMQRRTGMDVTGLFNRVTMLKLLPPGIRGEVMAIVHGEVGVHEWPPGTNRGEVLKYLKAAGIPFGAPWCVSFVYWTLLHAGFKREHLPSGPASTPNWYTFAKAHNCLKPVGKSEFGDIWLWEWNNGDGMLDHGGFCDEGIKGYMAYYVDGNVGDYGGSVTDSQRSAGNIAYCIDLVKLHGLK
jgi:hypothetical protein